MVKKTSTTTPSKTKKAGSTTSTPSKKNSTPRKKPVSKQQKGRTIKGELTQDPDMEKEDDEEEQEVTTTTPKKPTKKTKQSTTTAASASVQKDEQLVPNKTIAKAITALSKYLANRSKATTTTTQKPSLFEDDANNYFLQITTTKFLASKPLSKPKSISIPHQLIDKDEDFKICLFVKDDVIDAKLLELIEDAKIPNLGKIITAKELKGEYRPFEAKRKLVSEYDLFLSDDYLIPTLPKLLGKIFYETANKFPIPVKVYSQDKFSIKTLTNSINKIISSVTYIPPVGVNLSLKIGDENFQNEDLIENAQAIIANFHAKLNNGNKIRTIQLKTLDSPSLPLYYIDKLYDDSDIVADKKTTESTTPQQEQINIDASIEVPNGVKLTDFEKGLLELAADPTDVEKILSKKIKQAKKRKAVDVVGVEESKKKKGKK